MRITGPIMALDLGSRTGLCVGMPGDKLPRSGTVVLKKPGEDRRVALANLMSWLEREFAEYPLPALIVVEAPLTLEGFRRVHSSTDNVKMQYGLHAVVEAMACRYGLRIPIAADNGKVRRHFMGQKNCGNRDATKAAVVRRAQVLGYMPKDCEDNDRADGISLWDFACAHYAGRIPEELVMFEDGRARKARPARA